MKKLRVRFTVLPAKTMEGYKVDKTVFPKRVITAAYGKILVFTDCYFSYQNVLAVFRFSDLEVNVERKYIEKMDEIRSH